MMHITHANNNSQINNRLSYSFNPLSPMSDQDRFSPYNINTTSTRLMMRIKKTINVGIIG